MNSTFSDNNNCIGFGFLDQLPPVTNSEFSYNYLSAKFKIHSKSKSHLTNHPAIYTVER